MPAPATVAEMIDLLKKSALLSPEKLDAFLQRHRAAGTLPQSVDQLNNLLVRDSLLSFFQAKQLRLGRYKRFTIGTKYRLLELIGAGGMGAVYLCEHTLMRRLVALKVLPVEKLEDKSNEERFYREARAVAALDHPNIVRAYDIDNYEKLHFLVMEYVDGTSLQEIISRYVVEKKPFDPVRTAHYIAQSAIGMQHAHELGMVHRDIKPGNLLLDRSGVIKILDMGLARFFNKQQDSVTEKYDDKCVLGTADYLAPEQAVSNMVDIRADIYALGGTMYFMLTGQTPFPDGTIAAKLVAHQTKEPRPVESFRSDVPPGMLAVLRKMMAKSTRDRYQQPIEVAEALAEWAEQPVAAPSAREMPVHCPLVQSLAAPTVAATSATPLARALFGSGRGVFARAGGSSSGGEASGRGPNGTGEYPTAGGPNTPSNSNNRTGTNRPVPAGARGSSVRGAAAGDVTEDDYDTEDQPEGQAGSSRSRKGFYAAVAAAVALLFVVGAAAAYFIGKGDKAPVTPPTQAGQKGPTPGAASDAETSPPTLSEAAFKPEDTARMPVGMVILVEFKVESSGGKSSAHLNSAKDFTDPANFAAHVGPAALEEAGKTKEQVCAEFTGKTIRVRGMLSKDAPGGTGIDVKTLKQVMVVPDK